MDVWETRGRELNEILRPPLAPSEKNNAVAAAASSSLKQRGRDVPSRYKAAAAAANTAASPSLPASAARRSSSPSVSRTTPSAAPKRSLSAERRRPTPPSSPPSSRPSTPGNESTTSENYPSSRRIMGGRTTEGLWPSTRSLSVSFQSDNYSLPVVKKEKPALRPAANTPHRQCESPAASRKVTPERKRTPLRGRNSSDQSENSKPVESPNTRLAYQHRWPSRTTTKVAVNSLTISADLTNKSTKPAVSRLTVRGISPAGRTPASDSVNRNLQRPMTEVARARRALLNGSEGTENGVAEVQPIKVDPPLASGVPKLALDVSVSLDSSDVTTPATRPIRTRSLPNSGSRRSPSPVKSALSTPSSSSSSSSSSSRSMHSPSRMRPSSLFPSSVSVFRPSSSSSVLSFTADVRKGKKGANQMEDAHQLRLLYNRYLQWRFVNARADTALSIQKVTVENILYNVWFATSKLRDSVTMKRINLQQLMLERKLTLILRGQMEYLDNWSFIEREHSSSLPGVLEALEASTLRVPVTGGARADIHTVKNAVSSAVDVLQAMSSSICCLSSKVEGMNGLVSELANIAARERAMLIECEDLLASTAALQVEESSLRTHIIQLEQTMLRGKRPLSAI